MRKLKNFFQKIWLPLLIVVFPLALVTVFAVVFLSRYTFHTVFFVAVGVAATAVMLVIYVKMKKALEAKSKDMILYADDKKRLVRIRTIVYGKMENVPPDIIFRVDLRNKGLSPRLMENYLCLPQRMLDCFTDEQIAAIIAHEAYHLLNEDKKFTKRSAAYFNGTPWKRSFALIIIDSICAALIPFIALIVCAPIIQYYLTSWINTGDNNLHNIAMMLKNTISFVFITEALLFWLKRLALGQRANRIIASKKIKRILFIALLFTALLGFFTFVWGMSQPLGFAFCYRLYPQYYNGLFFYMGAFIVRFFGWTIFGRKKGNAMNFIGRPFRHLLMSFLRSVDTRIKHKLFKEQMAIELAADRFACSLGYCEELMSVLNCILAEPESASNEIAMRIAYLEQYSKPIPAVPHTG